MLLPVFSTCLWGSQNVSACTERLRIVFLWATLKHPVHCSVRRSGHEVDPAVCGLERLPLQPFFVGNGDPRVK